MQEYCIVVIGMTSNTNLPLDKDSHSPGLSAWCGWDWLHFILTCSDAQYEGGDVGLEWKNGDILLLHLD